jgi:hypothetical protein
VKRIIIYVLILGLLVLAPVRKNDVGKLRPVESIALFKENGNYVIATDTDDRGRGTTVAEAIANLKRTTPAIIYLDTADYLLISEDAMPGVEELSGLLRGSVQLYRFRGQPDMKTVSQYLRVHGDGPNMKEYQNPEQLQVLDCSGKRMEIL